MAWEEAKSPQIRGIPHICLLVPHFGNVSLEWVETTYGSLRFIPQPDFAKSNRLSRGILNLDIERNELVKYALEDKTVTHFLWLDTDCLIESPKDANQAVRMLLACNTDIVSGLYRAKKSKGDYPYAMWMKNPNGIGYFGINKWTGNYINVDVLGLGFCLMRREVFEQIPSPWFVWGSPSPSEDFTFFEKAKQHGYEARVFTEVKLSHVGTMKVICDSTSGAVHLLDV